MMWTMRAAAAMLAAVAVNWLPGNAWAWGDVGHRIACELAFQELTDAARREILELIQQNLEFRTFSDACAWSDRA